MNGYILQALSCPTKGGAFSFSPPPGATDLLYCATGSDQGSPFVVLVWRSDGTTQAPQKPAMVASSGSVNPFSGGGVLAAPSATAAALQPLGRITGVMMSGPAPVPGAPSDMAVGLANQLRHLFPNGPQGSQTWQSLIAGIVASSPEGDAIAAEVLKLLTPAPVTP